MPIRPDQRSLYPDNWPDISHHVRFIRARGQCECDGTCGRPHTGPCPNRHGGLDFHNHKPVVLTCAHRNHDPTDNRDENLAAWCAPCHLVHDADHHAATARATRETARRAAGIVPLFDLEITNDA
jgi:hypothetical protein